MYLYTSSSVSPVDRMIFLFMLCMSWVARARVWAAAPRRPRGSEEEHLHCTRVTSGPRSRVQAAHPELIYSIACAGPWAPIKTHQLPVQMRATGLPELW